MSEAEKERQIEALSIVTKLFNEYLESFISSEDPFYKITDYVIETISIDDPKTTDRIKSSMPYYDFSESAITASVRFYIKPEKEFEETEDGEICWNINWLAGGAHIHGSWISNGNVLIADIVDGKYQILILGSGW